MVKKKRKNLTQKKDAAKTATQNFDCLLVERDGILLRVH